MGGDSLPVLAGSAMANEVGGIRVAGSASLRVARSQQ
jgi:hypothetical protein